MNTLKLAALSTIFSVSALVACSTPADGTGSSENAATADIDHMFKRPNGNFDVWCTNGTVETDVTAEKINSNQTCGGGPATTSGGTSGATSGGATSGGATSGGTSGATSGGTTSGGTTSGGTTSGGTTSGGTTSGGTTSGGTTSGGTTSGGPPAPVACIGPTVPAAAAWKKPAPASQVCTPAALQALAQAASAGGDFKAYADAVAAVSAPCAACIFTDEGAAEWGPVITTDGGHKGTINWSACFARVQGGSDACGEKFHQQLKCGLDMCSTCSDKPSLQACYGQATGDAAKCGQYDVNAACGGNFSAVDSACEDPFDVIIANCGGK